MKRRRFLQFIAGLPFIGFLLHSEPDYTIEKLSKCNQALETTPTIDKMLKVDFTECVSLEGGDAHVAKYYINNEEIDSSRALGEYGFLRMPFQGAKRGDKCTVKSSPIKLWKCKA